MQLASGRRRAQQIGTMLVLLAPVPAVFGMASRASAARRFATTQVRAGTRPRIARESRAHVLRQLRPHGSAARPRVTLRGVHPPIALAAQAPRTVSALPAFRASRTVGRPLWRSAAMSATASAGGARTLISDDPNNNVTPYIEKLVGRNLHLIPNHPLNIIKTKIEQYFLTLDSKFEIFDSLDPVVTCTACFDDLNIPPGHPARKPSDTYYLSESTLLRTHTSAHQSELLRRGHERFLCTGDVYRRDEIDASHYPAFHQMEGVRLMDTSDMPAALPREEWLASEACARTGSDLKCALEGLVDSLFGPVEKRWVEVSGAAAAAAQPRQRSSLRCRGGP